MGGVTSARNRRRERTRRRSGDGPWWGRRRATHDHDNLGRLDNRYDEEGPGPVLADWSDTEWGWSSPTDDTDLEAARNRGDLGQEWAGGPGGWLPGRVEVAPRAVCIDGRWAATLVVVGLPSQVHPAWLEPLTSYPAPLELALHVESVAPEIAARQLRRQLARLESSRHGDATGGRLIDPRTSAAAEDAHELSERLARAQTRLHRIAIAITVHADTPDELGEHVRALRSLAASLLIDARPATWRALEGWSATLPIAVNPLGHRRVVDTDAAAACFPFASPELPAPGPLTATSPGGILLGHNTATHALVVTDRFSLPNYNQVILAISGAGKSFAVKLEILRGLYRGIEAIVIDPEDEYAALAATVGGVHIRLGAPGVRVNPFDLPGYSPPGHAYPGGDPGDEDPGLHEQHPSGHPDEPAGPPWGEAGVWAEGDLLARRALFLHSVLGVLLGELSAAESAVLDVAIHTAYARAGITFDPATWTRPPPLLADLADALTELAAQQRDPVARQLATRLTPYVSGSFAGLFNGPTTHTPSGHLTVYSLKALPEQLLGVGTLLALDATWRTVTNRHQRRPRVVVVDEAWLLLSHPAGAAFLLRLAKAARKHWCGLTLVTQDAGDVLATELGRAVVSNAATSLLLRTAPQAAERVAQAWHLSEGERDFLTCAPVGTGLLLIGGHRVALTIHASPTETDVITTDPRVLAARNSAQSPFEHHTPVDHPTPPGTGGSEPLAPDNAFTSSALSGWDPDGPDRSRRRHASPGRRTSPGPAVADLTRALRLGPSHRWPDSRPPSGRSVRPARPPPRTRSHPP
jgi:hypothetical protein